MMFWKDKIMIYPQKNGL